jgi:hypothetical protein
MPEDMDPQWEELDEEIDLAEIEQTANALASMIEKTKSETIKAYLQDALDAVSDLAEWEEVDDDEAQAA